MNQNEYADDVLKIAPPVGVSAMTFMGIPLSDMVYVMTIVYLLVQIGCTLYRTFKKDKK